MTLDICGYAVLVDDTDSERILARKWGLKERKQTRDGLVYFKSSYWQDGKAKAVYLHRFILDAPPGLVVDHINGNTLDNRRSNLRLTTVQNNTRNRKMDRRNKSGYCGVTFSYGKWRAYIRVDGKHVSLGRFNDKREAAMAYNKGAMKYFGEHARLNEVESAEPAEERGPEVGDVVAWIDRQSGEKTFAVYPCDCTGPSADNPNWKLVVLMRRAEVEAKIGGRA